MVRWHFLCGRGTERVIKCLGLLGWVGAGDTWDRKLVWPLPAALFVLRASWDEN